jgi:hypothetical protein
MIRAGLHKNARPFCQGVALTFSGHAARMNMTVDAIVGTLAVPSPAPFRHLGHETGALNPTASAPQRAPVTERVKLSQRSSELKRGAGMIKRTNAFHLRYGLIDIRRSRVGDGWSRDAECQ